MDTVEARTSTDARANQLASCACGAHMLQLLAQPSDPEPNHITRTQIHRRFLSETHTSGCTCRDDVAGMQAHHRAQVADQSRHTENHVRRIAVLITLAVHLEPQTQRVRIGNFVACDEPGTGRTKRVAAFAFIPSATTFELILALRDVVNHAVPSYVRHRVTLGDVPAKSADHYTQL